MWTQLQSIRALVFSCALGLVVPATMASSQTLDDSVKAVQPNGVRAAERHQAGRTDSGVSSPVVRTVLQDSRFRTPATVRNSTRSTPMNRTAQAHLESLPQATGLPTTAMICQNCDPEPPCRGYRCGSNSPTIDGAAIVVHR